LHRLVFTANGELYAGGIARGSDQEFIHRVSGLTRLRFTGKEVFEPLAARVRSNGLEIEFTQPLAEGHGWNPAAYHVTQWGYQATQTYGGNKIRHRTAEVRSATVSADRRRVFLELPGLKTGEVVHVLLSPTLRSASGAAPWAGEFWTTVNRLPKDQPGLVQTAPPGTLAGAEPFFQFSHADAGQVLFQSYCAACHSLDGTKLVGPSFRGLAGARRTVRTKPGGPTREVTVDAAYLRESILEPNALLVDGYAENLMPPVGALLTDAQLDALVNYLLAATQPK
jgi:cytochrome c